MTTSNSQYTSEFEFLLNILRDAPMPLSQHIERAGTNLNWHKVYALTMRHGLSSILSQQIRNRKDLQNLPKPFRTQLAIADLVNKNACTKQLSELDTLLRIFNQAGIPVIPYKGVALSQQIYKTPLMRHSGDIDLIVHYSHLSMARKLLTENGYIEAAERFTFVQRPCKRFIRNHIRFDQEDRSIIVELHWDITHLYTYSRYSMDAIWGNLTKFELESYSVRSFSDTDLLLALCLHGTKHEWSSLKWLLDIHHFIDTSPSLDWEKIVEASKSYGISKRVFVGLWLADKVLHTPIPESVLVQHIRQKAIEKPASEMLISLCATEETSTFKQYHQRFFMYDTWADGFIFLAAISGRMLHTLIIERRVPNVLRQFLK